MHVSRLLRHDDAVRKQFPGFFQTPKPRQQLPELKVARYVVRIVMEEFLEMFRCRACVAFLRTFHRQPVSRKRIRRFLRDEPFQHFSSRFLGFGHGPKPRIIAARNYCAKHASAIYQTANDPKHKVAIAMPKKQKADTPSASASHNESKLPPKPVSASKSELVEAVLPNDANPLGAMLGGRVMHLIDIAGALAAHRHSNSHVVTASVDYLDFRFPIHVGEFIVLKSSVNRVFHTSMEVGVKVFSENVLTGERKHTSSAYVTYVAIDLKGEPRVVPPLILETEDDRRRYHDAGERRRVRLAMRHKAPLSHH